MSATFDSHDFVDQVPVILSTHPITPMPMDTGRPSKRPRTSRIDAFHDPVHVLQNFDLIHSTDGRLLQRGRISLLDRAAEPLPGTWEQRVDWEPADDEEYALDPDGGWYNEAVEADVMQDRPVVVPAKVKAKRSKVSKRPHVVWMEQHRQAYLDEIMRAAGRGDFQSSPCTDCKARGADDPKPAEYRCEECFVPDLVCQSCCVKRHRSQPFHWIQKWTGTHFVRTSLRALGLKVQLNHSGPFCESPISAHTDLLILHTNGIHSVNVQYCGCSRAIPHHLQLLRRRLYPASQISVKTCATFQLLRHLHRLAWTTKASTYDFYRCLEKSTTNTGLQVPRVRYKALSRMVLQWRHLQMLKWAGRGNNALGVAGTSPGELAVRCPSCPQPGINLLTGWEDAPKELRFLYMAILCMDANFRLKNQIVSNYSQDPGLGIGWAYMVPRQGYEAYVLSMANEEDISTCVGFQALAKANTKFSAGLRYTGVNAVVCGRSEMVMPLGVGNLQKGERYANMDYVFGLVLRNIAVALVLISYDIACQWFVNLFKRMTESWPQEIRPQAQQTLIPAIPKLHEPMHRTAGHEGFSFNFIHGVGETDGECPERLWSPHNALGNSTKTQGPGSRQDVLDDHFGFWNWQKYISMGTSLMRRYKAAVALRNLQIEGHKGLTGTLDGGLAAEWEKMCVEWEEEIYPKTKENPYHTEGATMSEAQAKKELADEESRRIKAGGIVLHETSAHAFIVMGLDLEEAQRRLRRQVKGGNATVAKEGALTEQRNGLRLRLRGWEQLRPIYMPGLLQYETDHPTEPASEHPEDAILWLPSRLPPSHRQTTCVTGLPAIEEKLRIAQCTDALDSVRRILRIKSRMIQFKNKNLRGQRDGTRSRAVIDRVHERARASAEKYRAARAARLMLSGPGQWEDTFRVLEDGDIRGYQDANKLRPRKGRRGTLEDDQLENMPPPAEEAELDLFDETRSRRDGTGETRRTLSWIWTTNSSSSGPGSATSTGGSLPPASASATSSSMASKSTPLNTLDSTTTSSLPTKTRAATSSKKKRPSSSSAHASSSSSSSSSLPTSSSGSRSASSSENTSSPSTLQDKSDDILRGEWARSRARATRASEEVMLLKEEMGRVLRYLDWKGKWWASAEGASEGIKEDFREGIHAVASKNAELQQALRSSFQKLWTLPLEEAIPEVGADGEKGDDDDDEDDDDEGENGGGGAEGA